MLAIATFYEIWQMGIKTTFLNGFIKEDLYMIQPEGFVNPKGANRMCIPWQDFEVVQNGTVKEGVLACVARCEVE